jgi:putative phosphonoacetaldehyde dehydrogenase
MFACGAMRERAERLILRNPYSGEVVGSASMDRRDDVEEAIASVRAYDRRLSAAQRSRLLAAAAGGLLGRKEEFALSITRESGLCLKDSRNEVERAVENLRVAAEEAKRIHGEALQISAGDGNRMAATILEPVGVVCAITPFNRPLNQVVVKVAPAIAANDSIVVKPSEKTPLTALLFAQLLTDHGVPSDMIAVVTGDPREIGDVLLASPQVDMVTFTGSVETGEHVARTAGLKKLLLELGGNDPLIVLGDADLAVAAQIAARGALATTGQSCRGIKRILVAEEVADAFVPLLVEQVRRWRCGDPFDPEMDMGTLASEEAARAVEERCAQAVRDGAVLLCGGERKGAAMLPTALDHVPAGTELVVRETFGPVAPVIRVRDLEEAITVANGTAYGLQAGVITRSFDAFVRLARGLRVGAVNLMEGPGFDSPHIPFGGVKKSGIGREGMRYAIREMTTIKTVVMPW